MVIRNLGLIDTPLAMILPQALSVFNILIMRTSMPVSYTHLAARIYEVEVYGINK